jgi:small subunit ribosomal protein S7
MEFFETRKKLVNHLMKNGKKTVSEKILLNSFKELQKISLKQSEDLMKNALINAVPLFKIYKSENKKQKKKKRKIKEIPFFILSTKARISFAIKLIIKSFKEQKYSSSFFKNFNNEILLNNQQKGLSNKIKTDLQKKVILNKKYFHFYRWC